MNKTLAVMFTVLSFRLNAQEKKMVNQPAQVMITDWKEVGLFQNPQVFIENKDSIVAQIGEAEFEKFKEFGNNGGWPDSIAYDITRRRDSLYMRHYYAQLNKLKMYKIASYVQVLNGEKHARHAILCVPYDKNKNWNKNVRWDTIYFVIIDSFVKNVSR